LAETKAISIPAKKPMSNKEIMIAKKAVQSMLKG
jgi:hypothetical protein